MPSTSEASGGTLDERDLTESDVSARSSMQDDAELTTALLCVYRVRTDPYKTSEYELHEYLREASLDIPESIATWVNERTGLPLLSADLGMSSGESDGLAVLLTNSRMRLLIDLLLANRFVGFDFDITTFALAVSEEVMEDGIRLDYVFPDLEGDPYNPLVQEARHLLKDRQKRLARHPREVLTMNEIVEAVRAGQWDWSASWRGKYIRDFDAALLRNVGGLPEVSAVDLDARDVVFGGAVTDFANTRFYGSTDFSGAIFLSDRVKFDDSIFEATSHEPLRVSFRNARFSADTVSFDRAEFRGGGRRAGADSEISFEDSVFEGTHFSFARTEIDVTQLSFFQAIMPNAEVRLVDTVIADTECTFEDAVLRRLLIVRVSPLAQSNFQLRRTTDLAHVAIQHSRLTEVIRLGNVATLSLRGTVSDAAAILINHGLNDDVAKGETPFEVLDAVSANNDKAGDKAQQFMLLKRNFADLGQYDLEDEAFARFMDNKENSALTTVALRFMKLTGRYGIAPGRILVTMFVTWLIFTALFIVVAIVQPVDLQLSSQSVGSVLHAALVSSTGRLISVETGLSYGSPLVALIALVESAFGWFFLGYLSVAIIRKTLR